MFEIHITYDFKNKDNYFETLKERFINVCIFWSNKYQIDIKPLEVYSFLLDGSVKREFILSYKDNRNITDVLDRLYFISEKDKDLIIRYKLECDDLEMKLDYQINQKPSNNYFETHFDVLIHPDFENFKKTLLKDEFLSCDSLPIINKYYITIRDGLSDKEIHLERIFQLQTRLSYFSDFKWDVTTEKVLIDSNLVNDKDWMGPIVQTGYKKPNTWIGYGGYRGCPSPNITSKLLHLY